MASDSSFSPAQRSPLVAYHVLKALGLRLLAHFPILRNNFGLSNETPKQIMRTSVPMAIAGLTIHIFPILVSAVIIALNMKYLFLGRSLPGIIYDDNITTAIFQVMAKIHELLIVSSLSTIIFSAVRVQLLYGTGVPLGMLCSGFNFPQITYFWSEEYWGAMTAPLPRRTLFPFGLLLLTAGLIAVTAGPASALLMLPRQQAWSAGGTSFYLRGLIDDLQPSRVVAAESTMNKKCLNSSGISLSTCPSSGFLSLMSYAMKQQNIKNGDNLRPPALGITGQFGELNVTIDSVTTHIPSSQLAGDIRGVACQTSVLGSWIPVTMYQDVLYNDWIQAYDSIYYETSKLNELSQFEYKYNFGSSYSTRTSIPIVRTACSPAQNVSSNQITVDFPILPRYSCWNDTASIDFRGLESKASRQLKVTWLPLPSAFGTTSTGMVFESPWSYDGGSRIVVGCSIDARWIDGRVGGSFGRPPVFDINSRNFSESWGLSLMGLSSQFRPSDDGSWTSITLDESWLASLTPLKEPPSPLSSNMTTFETILQSSALIDHDLMYSDDPATLWNEVILGSSNRTIFLEWLTSLLISDGLSRYGSERVLNFTGPPSEWSLMDYHKESDYNSRLLHGINVLQPPKGVEYTTFEVEFTLQGLSYQAQIITDYLSIAVLSAHIVLALVHTVYVLRVHQSSDAWGTIIELIILAYNSHPTSAMLHNISAGIKCIKTYQKVVIVRETHVDRPTAHERDGDHKQAELIVLTDNEGLRGRKSGRSVSRTWPLMSSQSTSNIELTENRAFPSNPATSLIRWYPRSSSGNSTARRRLLDGPEEQQRIKLNGFYS
ncbi:hypothetical protein PFICI_03579 [Pestalotiopsis fici W106-1]|uniref:Uncharacterized protein n=1 Tax=Pestalotiopsis fici (strain W106-1 / CGMCC3.15140) TaxID=1229662 RepID=W3XHS5_PESFW|nr:uncharacterized protein PFICI_03579 [Pestalotiopsis fici W106-1]ETS85554.1 hypothetical protein PFICI_03579 [Pestalotiopsis fici W106-1]